MSSGYDPNPTMTYMQQTSYGTTPQTTSLFGAPEPPKVVTNRRSWNFVSICISYLLPCCIFAAVFAVMSFAIPGTDFWEPTGFSTLVCVVCFVPVAWFGWSAFQSYTLWAQGGHLDASWITFLFFSTLLAWVLAMVLGSANYRYNTTPYAQIANLKSYTSVDPGTTLGMQVLDAGSIAFKQNARLDLSKSMGFKSGSVYCVAPVVSDNSRLTYDFWAVGVNCCSDGNADYHCGDYQNPKAKAGLRVWRNAELAPYRSAVKEAVAEHHLNVQHVILLTWMEDPTTEFKAYKDDSVRCYCLGIYIYVIFHFFCLIATIMAVKLTK